MATYGRLLRFVCLAVLGPLLGSQAHAQRQPITREQIISNAQSGVGHGYHWGADTWTADGTRMGTCTKTAPDGCPNCTYAPASAVGADCSGYVSKAWQVPTPAALDVPVPSHYRTGAFYVRESGPDFVRIDRSELRAGDALVYRKDAINSGHVVLFDKFSRKAGLYWVYEARGCDYGIVHNERHFDENFIAIRRLDVTGGSCTVDTCHGHGACTDGTCACEGGFTGQFCEHCSEGFTGYPSCHSAREACGPQGALSCEQSVQLAPHGAGMNIADYSCSPTRLEGGELVLRFSPEGTGTATLSLDAADQAGGAQLLVMRGSCQPNECIAGGSKVSIDYADDEVYYVSVDSRPELTSDVRVKVDCTSSERTWVGSACNTDADCVYHWAHKNGSATVTDTIRGFCYSTSASQGFCSKACTNSCEQLVAAAQTYCVTDPAKPSQHICAPRSEALNRYCTRVPGTASIGVVDAAGRSVNACLPPMSDACTGSFQGDVVDFQSGAAVTLVHIEASGGDPKTKLTVNAAPDGGYASDSIPCGPYALQISAPGYYPTTIYAHVDAKTTTQIVQLKAIPDSMCSGTGSATGLVFDALTKERKPIAGATLSIEPGVGAAGVGPVMFETQSGADGRFSVSELSSGYYTAAVSAPGFAAGQLTLMVCGGSTRMDQDIALTPRMDGVAMRVILTWKQPNDLDLHAQLPDGNELYFYTPCRGMQQSYPYASLDVDRKMANGPETVSFARFQPGTYTFFVHNYSEQIEMAKQHLSASAAEVVVLGMGDQELGRFAVPSTGSGVFWDVFSIEGTAPSQLHPIQSINNARANPETGYSQDCRP